VRRDFLESLDPRNGNHAGVVVDREMVSLGCVDFASVDEPDYKHYGSSLLVFDRLSGATEIRS
jgi:hypothetical protein